jgi:hypothetical protein
VIIRDGTSDTDISLPKDIGFNSKIFYFSFNIRTHRLFVELQNDERQTVSAGTARRAFECILQAIQSDLDVNVMVYIATTKSAVDIVLSTPVIRKIEIRLDLPNDDDLSDAEEKALKKIKARRIKRYEQSMTKLAAEDSIKLLKSDKTLAYLSKDNGFTKVWGEDGNGAKVERSTSDFPEIGTMEISNDEASYRQLNALARADRNEQEN